MACVHASALSVVPASVGLASAEAQLMNKLGRELRLRDQLLAVESSYDYMMIDTPPSLGVLTINALVAATRVIIPTEARFFSFQGLQMLEESIEEILYLNPRLEVLGILLSKMDRRLEGRAPGSGLFAPALGGAGVRDRSRHQQQDPRGGLGGHVGVPLCRAPNAPSDAIWRWPTR